MCMGLGCNAAGVVGCRIISSPRERLLAILTNSFVPCNGRFPAMIAIITMFFGGMFLGGIGSALILCGVIVLGVLLTLLMSWLLSKTLLRGFPSFFTLELPPWRRPQIGKVLARSVLDRTLFVLLRALCVAVPAGAVIYLCANIPVGGTSLLGVMAEFFDPLGQLMGLDGFILLAFVLGLPANEIVLPIVVMGYLATGALPDLPSLSALRELLLQNGWGITTAVCYLLFSLCHFPCATTLLSVKKETGSLYWTVLSALLPTVVGVLLCMGIQLISSIF